MDRDFVLLVTPAESSLPCVLAERGPDGKAYALVSFRPKFSAGFAPSEVVFLVDRSGSMQGTSIHEARKALELALRSLRPGCFFNVVGFGSSFSALFPESQPFGDSTLASALSHVRSMDGDMGGTEILPALKFVLDARGREGLPRQVFVITDGEVSNTDAVIELVRHHGARTRVFAFGIGAAPSHHLVKALARAGEGEAELIAPGQRAEEKILRQLGRALSAALTEVRVDWGGLLVAQAPYVVPPVFADGRVVVFGRVDELQPSDVTLLASSSQGKVAFPVSLDAPSASPGSLVATLWARRAIRDLEEGCSRLHGPRGSRQERASAELDGRVKAEIVRLGTTYGLMSRHTSFVAVETRETPVEGEVQLRKVPVAISSGWHGMPAGQVAFCESPRDTFGGSSLPAGQTLGAPIAAAPRQAMLRRVTQRFSVQEAPTSAVLPRLVALQDADGSWDLTDAFAGALGLSRRELERAYTSVSEDIARRRRAVDDAAARAQATLQSLSRVEEPMEELRRLVLIDLRGLALPAGATAPDVGDARQAVEDLDRRVRAMLSQLLEALERFRADSARKDQLRRAFATAFALRWLQARFAGSPSGSSDAVHEAHAWLLAAPLGATFWLEGMDRSQLLP
jgi:hypothetical protein